MNKILIVSLLIGLSLFSCVSAISVNYYYHPQCGHCQKISPFINDIVASYPNVNWDLLDTSIGSYNIDGTPSLELITSDKRKITLGGSRNIPAYLECELNEMSTMECPTTPYLNYETNSFFIR